MRSGPLAEMQVDPRLPVDLFSPPTVVAASLSGHRTLMPSRHHLHCCFATQTWHLLVAAVAVVWVAGGCQLPIAAGWLEISAAVPAPPLADTNDAQPEGDSRLQTMPLELTFVRYAEDDAELGTELWNLVDEQCLPNNLRHRLAGNGLRIGLVRGLLPPELAERLTPTPAADGTEPADSPLATDRAVVRRVIQTLPGQSNEIVATPRVEELVLLERDSRSAAEALSGQTYRAASAIFDARVTPTADGAVELELLPLIRHGAVERNWIGDDGAFRLEAGQQRTVMDRLAISLPLPADGVVIISCAGQPSASIGDAFFRDPRGRHEGCRLLVIRMLARTTDPMFSPAAGG